MIIDKKLILSKNDVEAELQPYVRNLQGFTILGIKVGRNAGIETAKLKAK